MLVKICQTLANITYVLRTVTLVNETNVEHDTAAYAACQVAKGLLDAIVELITSGGRVVSQLGHEVHCGCKDTTFLRKPCVLQSRFCGSLIWKSTG